MTCDRITTSCLVLALAFASLPLGAQQARHPDCQHPSVPGVGEKRWFSFRLGDLLLEDMPPARVRVVGEEPLDGYQYERIELTAPRASFRVEGSVLSGQLTDIYLCGLYLSVQGEERPRLRIPPGGLIMTLRSQLPPIDGFHGGQLVLPHQRTWLSNPTEIRVDPKSRTGEIGFETHPVKLRGLVVELPLVGRVSSNAVSRARPHANGPTGGPAFAFDLADSSLRLKDGEFDVEPGPFLDAARRTFSDATHWLQIDTAKVAGIVLAFRQGVSELTITDPQVGLEAIVNRGGDVLTAAGQATFRALKGSSSLDSKALLLDGAEVAGGAFTANPTPESCDALAGIDDKRLRALGLDELVGRRAADAQLERSLASSKPEVYATVPLAPLRKAIEAALPAALRQPHFSTCPSELVANGALTAAAGADSAEIGVRVAHRVSISDVLAAVRTVEGGTLRGATLAAVTPVAGLSRWLEGRLDDALAAIGPLPTLTMNAPFLVRSTVSTAAWGGGPLSGSVAHPQTSPLGRYQVFLNADEAHVLGGLQ